MASKSHITVASSQGMKAGLRAYMGSLAGSGLEQVGALYDELSDMNSRDRFAWYCDRFGTDVSKAKAQPRSKAQRVEVVHTGLEAEIAQAKARLEELLAQASQPVVPSTPRKAKKDKSKGSKWAISVVARNGGKPKVGSKFQYTNSQGVQSTWAVTSLLNDTHLLAAKVA